ncbi:hypothetical protein ACSVBT_05430 [Afipia sp. TerB]
MLKLSGDCCPIADARSKRVDAFASLAPFGWWGSLIVILAFLWMLFFASGYFLVYWRNADMDFMILYRALSLNDGAYVFFEHPAYLSILSTKWWLQLLHHVGWIEVSSLSAMPPVHDVSAFDYAMTMVVRAGRVLSALVAAIFVLVFAGLIKRLLRDWRIAIFATFAFAFSGGIAVHLRILRTELISGCLLAFAVMILIAVGRRGNIWRPLAVGFAATLCVLALENKVHAVLLVAALPILIVPFGTEAGASSAFWRSRSAWVAVLAAALAASLLVWGITPILIDGFAPENISPLNLRPVLLESFGIYQVALLLWIAACIVVFACLWRVSLPETLATLLAVISGASFGLSALYISYDVSNAVVVLNPLEQMLRYADPQAVSIAGKGNPFAAMGLFLSGIVSVLQRYSFVLFTSTRPTVFFTWLIFPGIVYLWRRGDKHAALQAALLMLAAVGIDALGVRRGLKSEYFILTDPLIILAGAILLDRAHDLRFNRWAYPIGATLVVLHIVISQAEPVRLALKRAGPESICDWRGHYLPRLLLPWCEQPQNEAIS